MEYGFATQNHTYKDVSGLTVVPRAVGHAVVIELHESFGMRQLTFSAMRQNRPPEIPPSGDLQNDTYVGGAITLPRPTPVGSGDGYNWMVSGEYTYLQTTNRVAENTGFPTGTVPYDEPLQELAVKVLNGNIDSTVGTGDDTTQDYRASINDDTFPWPFTRYPSTLLNSGLIV